MGRLGPTVEASPAEPAHCGMLSRCSSAEILGILLRDKHPCGGLPTSKTLRSALEASASRALPAPLLCPRQRGCHHCC